MEEGRSIEDDFADVRRVAALITYLFSLLKDRVLIAEVNVDDMEEMQTLVEILHDKNEHIVIGLFDCSKDRMIISFCVPKESEPLLTAYDFFSKVFEPMKLTNVTVHTNAQSAEDSIRCIYTCELIFREKTNTKEIVTSAIVKTRSVLSDLGI